MKNNYKLMVRNYSGKNTLFYGMICLTFLAGACKKPKNAASHLLSDAQHLVELQNEAAKDSVLSDKEKMNAFEAEIEKITTEFKQMKQGKVNRLAPCKNYDKLSEAMFEVMHKDK
ncbi:MAG: hypothetical protein ACP5DZ_05440 [Bacteroidales bacterium]